MKVARHFIAASLFVVCYSFVLSTAARATDEPQSEVTPPALPKSSSLSDADLDAINNTRLNTAAVNRRALLNGSYEHLGLTVTTPQQLEQAINEIQSMAQGRRVEIVWVDPNSKTSETLKRYLVEITPDSAQLKIVNIESDNLQRRHKQADAKLDNATLSGEVATEAEQTALRAISKKENAQVAKGLRRWMQAVGRFTAKVKSIFTKSDPVVLKKYGTRIAVAKSLGVMVVWLTAKASIAAGWKVMSVAALAAVSTAGINYLFTKYQEGWAQKRASAKIPVVIAKTPISWFNPFSWLKAIYARFALSGFARTFNSKPLVKALLIDPLVRGGVGVYLRYLAYCADPTGTPPPWSLQYAKSWASANADVPVASAFDMKLLSLHEKGAVSKTFVFWGFQIAGLVSFVKATISDTGLSVHPLGWVTLNLLTGIEVTGKTVIVAADHFMPALTKGARQIAGAVPLPDGNTLQILLISGELTAASQKRILLLNGVSSGMEINVEIKGPDGQKQQVVNEKLLHYLVKTAPKLPAKQTKLQSFVRAVQGWLQRRFSPLSAGIRSFCGRAFGSER